MAYCKTYFDDDLETVVLRDSTVAFNMRYFQFPEAHIARGGGVDLPSFHAISGKQSSSFVVSEKLADYNVLFVSELEGSYFDPPKRRSLLWRSRLHDKIYIGHIGYKTTGDWFELRRILYALYAEDVVHNRDDFMTRFMQEQYPAYMTLQTI